MSRLLYMRKGVLAALLIAALLAGAGLGFGGGWYCYVRAPQERAREIARQQQEELNRMVRSGEAAEVKPDAVTIRVEKGGGDIGQTITARTNEYTTVQIGMSFVSRPGEKTDLTKWFRAGDYVDMLYRDGQALALHRDLRPGEQPPAPLQGPPAQEQPQGQGRRQQ